MPLCFPQIKTSLRGATMTQIIEKNPHQAFEDALTSGVLTMKTVGEYMCMYTDAIKGDAFKNITTRKYIYIKS